MTPHSKQRCGFAKHLCASRVEYGAPGRYSRAASVTGIGAQLRLFTQPRVMSLPKSLKRPTVKP